MGWGLRKGEGDVTRGEAMIGFEICSSNEVQGKWCTVAGGAIRGAVGGDVEGYERDETRAIDRSAMSLESHGSRRRFDSVGVGVGVLTSRDGWAWLPATRVRIQERHSSGV